MIGYGTWGIGHGEFVGAGSPTILACNEQSHKPAPTQQ
jgi:hypothetical protein